MISEKLVPKFWIGKEKKKISCKEKVKLMYANLEDFQEMLNDIVDEAVLIGIDEDQLKEVLLAIVKNTKNKLNNV